MCRIGDPISKALIGLFVDVDLVWRVPLALLCDDDTSTDPVVDNPEADPIFFSELVNVKGVGGREWRRNPVFVSEPFYHSGRQRFSG
jgi:hypothetical protein